MSEPSNETIQFGVDCRTEATDVPQFPLQPSPLPGGNLDGRRRHGGRQHRSCHHGIDARRTDTECRSRVDLHWLDGNRPRPPTAVFGVPWPRGQVATSTGFALTRATARPCRCSRGRWPTGRTARSSGPATRSAPTRHRPLPAHPRRSCRAQPTRHGDRRQRDHAGQRRARRADRHRRPDRDPVDHPRPAVDRAQRSTRVAVTGQTRGRGQSAPHRVDRNVDSARHRAVRTGARGRQADRALPLPGASRRSCPGRCGSTCRSRRRIAAHRAPLPVGRRPEYRLRARRSGCGSRCR